MDERVDELDNVIQDIDFLIHVCSRERKHMSYHILVLCKFILRNRANSIIEIINVCKCHHYDDSVLYYPTPYLVTWLRAVVAERQQTANGGILSSTSTSLDGLCNTRCFVTFENSCDFTSPSNVNFTSNMNHLYCHGSLYCTGPWKTAPPIRDDSEDGIILDSNRELVYVIEGLDCVIDDFVSAHLSTESLVAIKLILSQRGDYT